MSFSRLSLSSLSAAMFVALGGCAGVEFANLQAREELARSTQPAGSAYAGWRVYQKRCAGCHGADAAGGGPAPDVLPRVRPLGERGFTAAVLRRYDWGLPPAAAAAREARIDAVIARREGALAMPDWQGQPAVDAHIADLHAYLALRAEGRLGPGQPAR